jgi:hypothetical protein
VLSDPRDATASKRVLTRSRPGDGLSACSDAVAPMIWDGLQWAALGSPSWLVRIQGAIYAGRSGPRLHTTGYNCYVMRSGGGTPAQTMTAAQRETFMSSLRPGSILRVWAFSPMADTYSDQAVFAEQDAIVADAKRFGHRLIFTLADWSGQANDGTGAKDATWLAADLYAGAYVAWVNKIVSRYAAEPTVAIWDLLNEPEARTFTIDLLRFVERMGALVKKIAPNALVMLGFNNPTISTGTIADYKTICASPYIDFCSYHDYSEICSVGTSFPAILSVARALAKPILIDELGIFAGPTWDTSGMSPAGFTAVSPEAQAAIVSEKLSQYATFPEVVACVIWSGMESGVSYPAYEPPPGSPARAVVRDINPTKPGFNTETVKALEGWFGATDTWRSAEGGTARIYKHGAASGSYSNTALVSRHSVRNGRPAWECGSSQRLWTDLHAGAPTQTWFAVVQPTSLTADREHYLIGADNQGGLGAYVDGTTAKIKMCVAGRGIIGSSASALVVNKAIVVEFHYTAGTGAWSIWLNGVRNASGSKVIPMAASNTIIAAKYSWQSGGEFKGYIFEMLKYSADLTASDAGKVSSYLRSQYGL